MLHKQFLNDKEHNDLLNIVNSLKFTEKAIGSSSQCYFIDSIKDDRLDNVIYKTANILLAKDTNYKINRRASVFMKVYNFGWIGVHKDFVKDDIAYTNLNILLKKPKEGGIIIHGNKKIEMEEKDLYILNGAVEHGISSLKSNDEYYSLVLWFYK